MKPNDQNATGLRDALERLKAHADWMADGVLPPPYPMTPHGELVCARDLRSLLSRLEKAEQGSSNASRARTGPVARSDGEAEPSAPWRPIETHAGEDGYVLLYSPAWKWAGASGRMMGYRRDGKWRWDGPAGTLVTPTHWMPLPEAPR